MRRGMSVLKPCPFCGQTPKVQSGCLTRPYIHHRCNGLGILTQAATRATVIRRWNRRYPHEVPTGDAE